jgi:hypothetical protein
VRRVFASFAVASFAVRALEDSANIPCVLPSFAYAQNLWFAFADSNFPVRRAGSSWCFPSSTNALCVAFRSSSGGKPDACDTA